MTRKGMLNAASRARIQLLVIVSIDLLVALASTSNTSTENSIDANKTSSNSKDTSGVGNRTSIFSIRPIENKLNAGLKRQGRLKSLSDDFEDHKQPLPVEEPEVAKPTSVPKEGIMQIRRAARNAQRKMNLISGRLDQIQSLIAEDHKPANGQNLEGSSPQDNSNYENSDKVVSSTPIMGLVNNIEAPNQNQDQWPVSSGGEESDSVVGEQPMRMSNTNSTNKLLLNEQIEWSSPVNQIKSVIPTRQTNQNEQDSLHSRRDNDDSGQPDQQAEEDLSPKHSRRLNLNGDSKLYSSGTPKNGTSETGASSMLGVEFNPNQNYQYFSDLNAENHRQVRPQLQESARSMVNANSGAVAFRPYTPPANQARQKLLNGSAEADLMNSYSNSQEQQALPSTTSTTRSPSRKSAVHTYSSSNYGKSSKDQSSSSRGEASIPFSAAAPATGESYEFSDYSSNDNSRYSQEPPPIQWPSLPSSYQPISGNENSQDDRAAQRGAVKSVDSASYSATQAPMLAQESGQTDTVQPKVNAAEYDNNLNVIGEQNQMFGSSPVYQQQASAMGGKSTPQDPELAQASYNNNQAVPVVGGMDEMVQESTSEPVPERQKVSQDANNSELARHQQLSRMAAAIVTNNPSLGGLDINSLLQNYQHKQRILAAQAAQQKLQARLQQQHLQALPYDRGSYSISRASHGFANEAQIQANAHSVNKRYSPDLLSVYQDRATPLGYQVQYPPGSENSLAGAAANEPIHMASPEGASYSGANPQYQPVYYDNGKLLSPYYRALQAIAMASANARTSSDYSQQNQHAPVSGPNNYSAGSGSLYATAAMQSPTVYESAAQQHRQLSVADSYGADSSSSGVGSNGQQFQTASMQPQGTFKRGYLNSLFKPTASSRYYYTPTILSPISLSSPASAVHSLYAPTIATAATDTLPTYYAANPYGTILAPAGQQDQAAQYQAFAAAANGLQAQYMEPEMAESSLMASDGGQPVAVTSSSAASESADPVGASGSKPGRGMVPWSNIGALLLGILPLGMVMSFLLPAVGVAGRKKRELELIGARNFSELLNWRVPSKVLEALIGAQKYGSGMSVANATAIISEQLHSLPSGQRPDGTNLLAGLTRRKSLLGAHKGNVMRNRSFANSLHYNVGPEAANFSGAVVEGPTVGTNDSTAGGVKLGMRKAASVLNLLKNAAQNMKRKHRSSITDAQWTFLSMFKNMLKLENILGLEEFKRQLASVAHTRALLAQQKQISEAKVASSSQRAKQEASGDSMKKSLEIAASTAISNSTTRATAEPPLKAQLGSPTGEKQEALDVELSQAPIQATTKAPATTTQSPIQVLGAVVEKQSSSLPPVDQPMAIDNLTGMHLGVCLKQFLCRLTAKLSKNVKSSLTGAEASSKPTKSSHSNPDQIERITKGYINQLVEQIEAQNPSVPLGLRPEPAVNSTRSNKDLDELYRSAMRNQCAHMYNCMELDRLEKTISKMKLKFS